MYIMTKNNCFYVNKKLITNKMIKNWQQFNESSGDAPSVTLDVKSQISKLKEGPKGGSIDLGKVSQVADSTIKNIKKTYKDAVVNIVDDRYILMLKENKNEEIINEYMEAVESPFEDVLNNIRNNIYDITKIEITKEGKSFLHTQKGKIVSEIFNKLRVIDNLIADIL